jgi:hypothetical protein
MDADSRVVGRAVAVAMGGARPPSWSRSDAKLVAQKLIANLPPFPPSPSPGKSPDWAEFGPRWLGRSHIRMEEASGWPLCCLRLDDEDMWRFKEVVMHAAWLAEVDRRRNAYLTGRPEEALARLGAGWLSPEGTFAVCTRLEHMAVLRQAGVGLELFTQLDGAIEQGHHDINDFSDAFEDEDHVPWHAYDSDADTEADRLRQALVAMAYETGWIRLGVGMDRERRVKTLSAEGTARALAGHAAQLEQVADICSMELAPMPVGEPATVGASRTVAAGPG